MLLNLAIASSRSGDLEIAAHAFRATSEVLGGNADYLASMAAHSFRQGDNAAAIDTAQRALGAEPSHFSALVTLSAALNELQRPAESLAALERAEVIVARHPALLYQLAYTSLLLGKCAKAKQAYERLAAIAADSPLLDALRVRGAERCGKLFRRD